MPRIPQSKVISVELELAAISGLYKNKIELMTAVVETLHVPRSTVRREKAKLLLVLKEKVRLLEE